MPSTEQKLAVVQAYIAAFEAGNGEAAAALFAEDATVEDPVGTPVKRGRSEILEFYSGSMATGAKLALQGNPRCAADTVAFPFTVTLLWGGQTSIIEVIDIFRLNDAGKITEMRAYWGPENLKSG